MGRLSATRSLLALGMVWACGLPGLSAQDDHPVEFEPAPKTLARFGPPVWSLAVSPDGKWTAAGQDDGRILVRDTIEKQTRHVFEGHEGIVSAVAFSPSGEYLASAGVDGQIRLWHVPSGRLQFTLTGHVNWITCLTFSPAGQTLASAGYDKTIRLWDVETGVQSVVFAKSATPRSLAFSPDGQTLVAAGMYGTIGFWDVKTRKRSVRLPRQKGALQAVAFSPDGKKLLSVPEIGNMQIWDLQTNKPEREFTAVSPGEPDTTPQTAVFSPDGLSILIGMQGGRVRVWSLKNGNLLQSLNGHEDVVTGLALTSDGKTLYTGSLDGTIQVWPALLPLESPLAKLPITTGEVWALALSPEGHTLAVGGKGGFVELWDLTTGQREKNLEGFPGTVDCLEYSPDGKLIAAAGWREETVTVWSVETGEISTTITGKDKVRSIALSPDGGQLAVGYKTAQGPEIFSLPEGKSLRMLTGHGLSVYDVAFSPDGAKIASCSGEWTERKPGRVLIHDAVDGAKLAQFNDNTHAIRSLTFTSEGTRLCSLSQDGVLKIYDVQGLRESLTLKNGLDARPVAGSLDGKLVAVGLQNGNVNLWNVERREIERRLQGTDDLFALEFSRDGSLLFAADGNDFVQIWKLSSGEDSFAHIMESWLRRPAIAESSAAPQPQETP